MLSAEDVATYFLTKVDPDAGDLISNLKIQKLCYYAQGFCLALFGKPLFKESIEAWQHGPVVPELYHRFKHHGGNGMPPAVGVDLSVYDQEVRELLDEVYEVYGQYSAWKLRNMTHEEAPWKIADANGEPSISIESMKEYFKTLVTKH